MISIIITSAFKEHFTIGKTIESILNQKIKNKFELIVVTPDDLTIKAVQEYKNKDHEIKIIKDPFIGKPHALNLAFKEAKGDILVLTDGDVFLSEDSINLLIEPFKNKKVGAVSGRPISLNTRKSKWGYFSHLLTDVGAHDTRVLRRKKGKMIVCSGYFYAFRKNIVSSIPENALSEDAVLSHFIYEKGYETVYVPSAKVFVKYPDNFQDWIKQKRRSAGGYNQLKLYLNDSERMRSFSKEALNVFRVFSYPKNIKEFIWTFELIMLRAYLWFVIYKDINLAKKDLDKIWLRVASTK